MKQRHFLITLALVLMVTIALPGRTLALVIAQPPINDNGNTNSTDRPSPMPPPTTDPHEEGTNLLFSDGTVYRILGNARAPYTSAGAYLSYKFNSWANAITPNSADQELSISTYTPTGGSTPVTAFIQPRNGSLINDHGTVYIISSGLRYGFTSASVFTGMGFSFSNVYPGDTSFMVTGAPINSSNQIHPNGTLVNQNGTLYVIKNGYRAGFPSMAVLDSWGYWVSDAVMANTYDRAVPVSDVLQTRMANQMNL